VGPGWYVRAVVDGYRVPQVPPWPDLRKQLEQEAERDGPAALHARLAEVDPAAAVKIDFRNVRRVIRALEVYEATGQPMSTLQRKRPPPYRILQVGLTLPRDLLYRRIDQRVDRMMELGLEGEVRRLVEAGYSWGLPSMSALGYRQVGDYLRGQCTLEEAISQIKRDTRRFVHHQYTWFRLTDPRIHWFDAEPDPFSEVRAVVEQWA